MSTPNAASVSNPFTEKTAGAYFVGREEQLANFREHLTGLRSGEPKHLYVAGLHGTGKTSYLDQLVANARSDGFLAAMPTLDERLSARDHISNLIRKTLVELDSRVGSTLRYDWDKGAKSTLFNHPKTSNLTSDLLGEDFAFISRTLAEHDVPGAVICIDEGQRIEPGALSALKNALQNSTSYLFVLSLRLPTTAGGVVESGRALLDEKAAEAEGDIGASRFFASGLAMGPFESEPEAVHCINRRLENNAIAFAPDVMATVARVSGRVPHEIIRMSGMLYEDAVAADLEFVDKAFLDTHFRRVYKSFIAEARTTAETMSTTSKSALRTLLTFGAPVTPSAVARRLYPQSGASHAVITEGIAAELIKLSDSLPHCVKLDETYHISDPIRAEALRLVLDENL